MTRRYRDEGSTLARLVDADQRLVGHAEALRASLAGAEAGWVLDHLPELRSHLVALTEAMRDRRDVLSI